ncbi:Osmotin, thaumatin-like protein [Auriscalpium vulgare]|uniref:Osmotin, thaumatin-like protein n=1 Tax=Auriscalpium vulgare TaxID=40419 RepID=A0ACB8S139_9AGAM|nr:Osmotin, thaumatin-like protein [Auriscalpium vulgare]
MFTDLTAGPNVPPFPTGWEAPPLTSVSFGVPDNWKAGRIWGRRDCNFTLAPGPYSCLTGGCNGGLLCDPSTGTGVPPATVAEWTLEGDGNLDFYDVSLVDGYNLPMAITNTANCPVADCPVDLGPPCPAPLIGPFDLTNFPVGCKSACAANLDNDPTDSANCCSGKHDTAATCPSSGVQYYGYFKGLCPNSYAYAFDESSNTALWTCDSALNADYTLTFCPPASGASVGAVSPVPASLIPTGSATSATSSFPLSSSPTASPTLVEPDNASGTMHMHMHVSGWLLLGSALLAVVILSLGA